jgi:hypothetical protein
LYAEGGGWDKRTPGANTGDGGGGSTGASGVVIIRHAKVYGTATTTGSPTITESGPWKIYKFTGSGTIEW